MADISKVNVNSTDYDLKDQKSRDALVEVVDNGAKNLLQFDSLPSGTTTYTTAGVKFDILSDGSVKAERVSTSTSVANAVLKIGGNNAYIDNFCNGKFILSGCPSGGGSSTYELMASITGGAYTKRDYGSGVLLTDKGSYSDIYVQCTVRSTFNGEVTFKPMLCTKVEWDISQEYVPYGKTNAELTNDTSTLFTENTRQETEISVVANAGAKNLLKVSVPDAKTNAGNTGFTWSGNTASKNHVSFEIKDDLTVYVKSDTGYTASDVTIFYLTDGSCAYPNTILNGCPSGGSATTYELRTATPVKSDYGSGVKITSDSATNVVIIIRSGWSGELTFRPMIRSASITDPTFQPYARTNRELTVLTDEDRAALVELVDSGAKNLFDYDVIGPNTTNIGTSVIFNGVRFTMNSDKSVTINRESSSSQSAYVWFRKSDSSGVPVTDFCDDAHVFSGAAGASVSTYTLFINNINGSGKFKYFGDGEIIGVPQVTPNAAGISISADYSPSNLVIKPMICTKAAWDISHAFQPYRLPYQEISDTVQVLKKVHHYGFIIDKNNSDSYTAVSYTHGAVGFSPAYMDYTNNKFVYGSWADAWFIRDAVPVALNFDGTEAFELDKSDFAKKADGTASGIDCITMVLTDSQPSDWSTNWKWYYTKSGDYYVAITAASAPTWAENTYYKAVSALDVNFMLRMPKVYFKRSNDDDHNYIEISDRQLDSDFHAYAHVDANGSEKDYIYLPLFKGSMINGKLRSVPNVWPQNYTTAQQEIDAATALGTGWQIWDHSSRELINDLLILISKSLDCQTTFGRGRESGYVDNPNQNYGLLKTGSLTDKGMFYGYSSSTEEVKVFGMESFWANRWDRILGLILKDNVWKIKMQPSYNLTADGYTTHSVASVPSGNGYFKSVHSSEYGSVPEVGEGEASKYYRDYSYKNSSGTRVALVGGACRDGARGGFRCVGVSNVASASYWHIGASPVYK